MNLELISEKIKTSKQILIVPSQPADLDCLLSALTIKWYVETQFQKSDVRIYSFFIIPEKLKIYPEINKIEEKFLEKVELDFHDLIIGVDGNAYTRYFTNNFERYLSQDNLKDKFINIDHHQSDPSSEILKDFNVTDITASSTTLLIYKTFLKDVKISPQIATWIYAGIVSDTGSFKWNINSETFKIASELVNLGAEFMRVNEINISIQEINFAVWAIEQTTFLPEIRTTLLIIERNQYEILDQLLGDNWEFKDVDRYYKDTFCKSIEGFDYYLIIKLDRKQNNVRITWRMRDLPKIKLDFIKLIKDLGYEGGGHLNSASARMLNSNVENVRQAIISGITSLVKSN